MEKETFCVLKTTKAGHVTCQVTMGKQNVLLHSAYDPVKEARQFIANHMENMQGKKKIFVYGLGCGHHITELLRVTAGSDIEIEVWEFNTELYEFVKTQKVIDHLLAESRLNIYVGDDKKAVLEKILQFEPDNHYIIIHQPSIKLVPGALKDIKEMFEIFQLNMSNMLVAKDILNAHYTENIKNGKFDQKNIFFNLLENVPMVLVGAGPSLPKNIEFLKKYRKNIFIGAVGSALKPLVNHGIIPDFFMLTDAKETVFNQFFQVPGSLLLELPMFYLSTVMPSVITQYTGPKVMLLQQGMEPAEKLAKQFNMVTVQTGGSVATTILDWMVQLGTKDICFVGQDLAYLNNQSHVSGSSSDLGLSKNALQSLMEIDDYFKQGKVRTPGNFYIYKKWIETYIWQHPEVQFFNATQGGAYIEGCRHVDFESFLHEIAFNGDMQSYKEKFKETVQKVYQY